MSKTEKPVRLHVDQLCPGVFISLSERWMDHPFLFNEFRISNENQIEVLRACGIDTVLCYPSRSTAVPRLRAGETQAPAAATPSPPPQPDPVELARIEEKRARSERVARQREKLARCEKAYGRTAGVIRGVMRRLHSSPRQAAEMAREVVDEAVAAFVGDQDAVLHLIGQKRGEENAYFHALNVMVLSLIMGNAEGLDEAQLQDLGMGALFHDLGKLRVPDAILKKGAERTRVEEDFYRLHTVYGEQIGKETGVLSAGALSILRHHHEHVDGGGFPDAIGAAKTSAGARIVAVANRYDNLCNGAESGGLTPAEALSHMFRKEGKWWDAQLLSGFIKLLGIYPPGSIVQLSNGTVGLVVAGNRADLLRPSVLLYDAAVPRGEANIVDLIDVPDVKIEQAMRRNAVPAEALEYLAPHQQMIYFYERESA